MTNHVPTDVVAYCGSCADRHGFEVVRCPTCGSILVPWRPGREGEDAAVAVWATVNVEAALNKARDKDRD